MPFKIYTYEDPYKLDKADFWSEISALPTSAVHEPLSMASRMYWAIVSRA